MKSPLRSSVKSSPLNRLLSRRNLLRNTALVTLLAPLMRRLEAQAQTAASPRRVILVFSPNGPITATGPASGTETAFTFHDWWKPLERHKDVGTFMSHMAVTGHGTLSANGHALGGQTYSGYDAGANGDQYAQNGETIDQVIAKRLQSEGRAGMIRSLVWGNTVNFQTGGTGDAFATGPGRNIEPELSPQKAWTQVFANFAGPDVSPAAVAATSREKSVLDFVVSDCTALQGALGAEGTKLLDEHCTTLRSMEGNLTGSAPTPATCARPAMPADIDWRDPEQRDLQTSSFNELMALTLACEFSHVIAFQIGCQAARNQLPKKYGVPSSSVVDSGDSGPAHHPWSHQNPSNEKTNALRIFTNTYAEQMASLIDKLKSTKDAMGLPLMDSTMVLWLSELGGAEGNQDPHITKSVPAVLFGNGQGTFKTGRYLKGQSDGDEAEAGRDNARLLVSMIQYMGLKDVNSVGAMNVNGPLTSLYV